MANEDKIVDVATENALLKMKDEIIEAVRGIVHTSDKGTREYLKEVSELKFEKVHEKLNEHDDEIKQIKKDKEIERRWRWGVVISIAGIVVAGAVTIIVNI